MDKKKHPLVLVKWIDSTGESGWTGWDDVEDRQSPMRCETVGWIRHSNKLNLTVVQSIGLDDGKVTMCDNVMVIPTLAIEEVVVLRK